ncbi:MAG: molecular chaperone DnaJ [Halieaceae bacterium]|nr:molecular chaperone DnaJ [Halieaceae bacterium]
MPRLILILAVAVVLYILFQRVQAAPPNKRKSEYMKLGLGVAVIVVIGLTVTGRMHWIGAALTGLLVAVRQTLPTLLRLFPMLASLRSQGKPAPGQSSTVETTVLRMHLNHDNGDLQGEVLQGQYQGCDLADMDKQQLTELLAYCRDEDAESLQLLDSYLARRFSGDGSFDQGQTQVNVNAAMSRKEALLVLGLGENASTEDIVSAHRKLMQKLHPDRGGNDYLAAKINQAKDLLTG